MKHAKFILKEQLTKTLNVRKGYLRLRLNYLDYQIRNALKSEDALKSEEIKN